MFFPDYQVTLNEIIFEGKTLSDWIEYFKINFEISPNGITSDDFVKKSSEVYYLYSKISPFCTFCESSLKRKFDNVKIRKINEYSEGSKRVPSQEIIDTLVRVELELEYKKLDSLKIISETFSVILKKYENLSYRIK